MKTNLTPIQEANDIINSFAPTQTEIINISQALNRKISKSIYSSENIPAFDKSAMDGYACKMDDINLDLNSVETIHAGKIAEKIIQSGECAKIMTGAKIPEGADAVFMYEDALILENGNIRCTNPKTKSNILRMGEDVKIGDIVISENTILKPHHIAILAGLGIIEIPVYSQMKIGVIATGTELVEPGSELNSSQIRNSNSYMILPMVHNAKYYGIANDDKESVIEKLELAFKENDVVLITGGASDSDFDMVPKVMNELGFNIEIRKVAMQPGKPFLFAQKDKTKFCFGLSGNPVSSYIQFLQFVQPFINVYQFPEFESIILSDFKRKRAERVLFLPGKISKQGVELVAYNGSAHISAFSTADVLVKIEAGINEIKKGDRVNVRQI